MQSLTEVLVYSIHMSALRQFERTENQNGVSVASKCFWACLYTGWPKKVRLSRIISKSY